MPHILLRDIPDEVVAAIDARAKRLGLSRSAYLRRVLERERAGVGAPVTRDQLARLAARARHLDDPEAMADAWS